MKTSKRIVSLLLVLTMLLGVFCMTAAAEELTITYHSNYPAEAGMADQVPGLDTVTDGYKLRDCAEWGWEYPAGYTLKGWSNGNIYAVGAVIPVDGSLSFNAVWEKTATDEPTDEPSDEPTVEPTDKPAAPAKGTRFYNAIEVKCTSNRNHSQSYSWRVDKTYPVKWSSSYKSWYITAVVKNLSDYVPGYGYTYSNGHYCDDDDIYDLYRDYEGVVSEEVLDYFLDQVRDDRDYGYYYYSHKVSTYDETITLLWNERYNRWEVLDAANVKMSCSSYNSACCSSKHVHTVRYTDGVSNKVVFKDKVYSVKHNGKTPTVKNPVREGYRFTGWSPKVSTYTKECVTYVAKWVRDDGCVAATNAPSLTDEHVAYLKGYGKGYIRPESKITRAEVSTILYRLLDESSLREYYTAYNTFSDVAYSDWYNEAVSTLSNAGIIKGYAGSKFYPNEPITRAELTAMLSRFVTDGSACSANFSDVSSSYWAYEEIALAQELGWIKGYGGNTFAPDGQVSRAEVAAILNRMLDRTDCALKDTKNYVDNPVNAWYYQDILEASIAH